MRTIDAYPYSRARAWLTCSRHQWGGPLGQGLYLRTHLGRGRTGPVRDLFLITVDGRDDFTVEEHGSTLVLGNGNGGLVRILTGAHGARFQASGCTLNLRCPDEQKCLTWQSPDGRHVLQATKCGEEFVLSQHGGDLRVEAPWRLREGRNRGIDYTGLRVDFSSDAAADIQLHRREAEAAPLPFDEDAEQAEKAWQAWLAAAPTSPDPAFSEARDNAAYILWSCQAAPLGHIKRPAVFMNKTHMDQVWSWDNCFNTIAIAAIDPELAWNQWAFFADHQDASGRLPDSVGRHSMSWSFCKPPIHGWAYRQATALAPEAFATPERQQQAYDFLAANSRWWLGERNWPGIDLLFCTHGNDSGWDNATVFDRATPTISPDVCAYLIEQLHTLADLAIALGKTTEAADWGTKAEHSLAMLLQHLWTGSSFVGMTPSDGALVSCRSLITTMPIILGTRLPTDIQEQLATQIGTFLCAYGLATEHPDSPEFHQHDHAYWRSSVWPPPSLIAVTSLAAIGKKDLAKRIATNTGRGMATCHFRENHDPQTGGERSDLAFTWTASVFLTLLDHLT